MRIAGQTRKKEQVDDDNAEDEDCWNEKETKTDWIQGK